MSDQKTNFMLSSLVALQRMFPKETKHELVNRYNLIFFNTSKSSAHMNLNHLQLEELILNVLSFNSFFFAPLPEAPKVKKVTKGNFTVIKGGKA